MLITCISRVIIFIKLAWFPKALPDAPCVVVPPPVVEACQQQDSFVFCLIHCLSLNFAKLESFFAKPLLQRSSTYLFMFARQLQTFVPARLESLATATKPVGARSDSSAGGCGEGATQPSKDQKRSD